MKRMEESGWEARAKESDSRQRWGEAHQRQYAPQHYQAIVNRLGQLRQAEFDLLSKFTAENILVKFNREQIADLEKQRSLSRQFPDLALSAAPGGCLP